MNALFKNFGALLFLVGLVLFVLIFSGEYYFMYMYNNMDFNMVLWYSVLMVCVPVVLFPMVGLFSRQIPLLESRKNALFHILFSIVYVIVFLAVVQISLMLIFDYSFAKVDFQYAYKAMLRQFSFTGSSAFLMYWGIVVLYGVKHYYKQSVEMMNRNNGIESQLSMAKLSALKAQLKPHFLFNTLSLVDYLIHTSPKKAIQTVTRLEELLKSTFDKNPANSCSLETELEFINKYLDIEKERFGNRLEVDVQLQPSTKEVQIPCYLIQPLVENSIKYGLSKSLETCTISIHSYYDAESLIVEVFDDGNGNPKIKERSDWGVGLSNVEERVKLYYGEDTKLYTSGVTPKGFKTSIVIPKKYLTNDPNNTCR